MPALDLACIRFAQLIPTLLDDPWIAARVSYFSSAAVLDACLALAIRRPDIRAVRMLLALGASPNGLPLTATDLGSEGTSHMIPLALALRMRALVGHDHPDLQRRHTETVLLLVEAGGRLDQHCYAMQQMTVRQLLWGRHPEIAPAVEAAAEALIFRRLLCEQHKPEVTARRI